MRIRELMTTNVKSCSEDTDLATAAKMMWDGDCGIVPVLNGERHVVGVITDRDICIAAATRSVIPAELRVRDVMSRGVAVVAERDDVQAALSALKEKRVRRLPVVDDEDRLVGIISLNDLVSRAECRRGAEVPGEEFLETMKVICAHPKVAAAAA
jgi:CBS domain-containing protein